MPALCRFLAPNQTSSVTNNGHLVFFESCLRSVLVCKMKVREMVHNGKSRPTFDLYSSPSANPRKLPLQTVSWPIRFASYPSAELLMFGIVQNLAWLTRDPSYFTCGEKMGRTVDRTSLKTGETWLDICGRCSLYAKRKYLAMTDQSAINVIGLSPVK